MYKLFLPCRDIFYLIALAIYANREPDQSDSLYPVCGTDLTASYMLSPYARIT